MKKIFMTMLAMLLASNLFADGDLFKVCFGTETAERGELYRHRPSYGAVSVLQVQRGGVLGKMHKMFSSSQFVEEKIIFVKMDTNGFSDGSVLPSGLYRCMGTVSYETAMGAMKTVPAFEKLSGAEENKIYQEAVEAEKRVVKERRERAIKEQPERQRIAESIIGAVDLNMGCIRIEKSIAPSFEISVKHFMWKKLAESKLKGDCLTFLNVADDIVNNRDDYTERFDLLPDKRTMQEVCDALKKHRFKCDFSCNERLVFLVPNSDWVNFIASCKSGKIQVSKGVRRVLYCVGDSYSDYEPTGVLSYAHEENGLAVLGDGMIIIGVEGSVEKYSRGDLKNKAVALTKKIEDKEIPLSEFKDEMLSMDSDAWQKITAELISIPRGAELDRIRKEDKDRRTANLTERKKMAEAIIGGIDLNMGCIRIEKSIAPSFEISVKHFMWKKLAESKLKGDCLTFLNVADDIVNNRDDYTERFDLLPDKRTMQEVCDALKKHRFKCDFSCNERLVFLVPNSDWVNFIASCKSGKIQVSKGVRQVLYCVGDSYSHYEPTGVLSYAHEENGLAVLGDGMIIIGVEGSVEKYSRSDLKNKAVALTKKIEDKEIPLSEFKDEMLSMNSDAWQKITAELISIPRGAELDRIRKEDKDRQAAKQKNARQEFVDEVSKLSFCLGDYIFFQKGLLEYTHSVTMDEQWKILAEFQTAGDWDGMARLVLGSSSDLSKAEQWVAAKKNLLSHEFKFTIFFTRDTGYYQRRKNGWAWRSFCFDDCLEISQKLDVSNPVYVYTSDRGDALFEEAEKSGFDILLWLNSHPADMTDHHIGGEFRKKPRPGSRDISALLKHKDDELNAAKEDLSRFRRAVASVKWPPKYLVVTNVSVVGSKMVYKEKKKTFKIPQKVRGLALLLDNRDVVELYGKYCDGLDLGRFKEEWKKAGGDQEEIYKKYKLAFESIEKSILKALESANPKARPGFGQPMSLEVIAGGDC